MDLAGEILKERREELGRDIHEVADLLKIRTDYLRAIEEDDVAKLPAPVYTIGYIRCYAKFLGIDAGSIVQYYAKNLSQPGPSTIIPVAFSQKKSSKISYALLVLLAVAGVLFYATHGRKSSLDRAEVPPAKPQPVKAAPAAPDVLSEKGGEFAAEGHSLGISASATSWVYLKFGDGRVEEMLLRPGESRNWSFSGKVSLKMGNAEGVHINLDGTDLGSPGGRGQVVMLTLPPR
jgi:transcriptional regulator with XRE-family HTH domain